MSQTMTEKDLREKIIALGLPEDDLRIPGIVCQLIGHSKIISYCFGYIHCARCGDQIGDKLLGYYDDTDAVVVGHNCEICRTNYEKLDWRDKFMAPDPFSGNSTLSGG